MNVIVPYSPIEPKTRLSPVLSLDERVRLSHAMVRDVVDTIRQAGHSPTLLAPRDVSVVGTPVVVDERSLSDAVNAEIDRSSLPVGLVMADLAIATEASLTRLFESTADVTIAPGRRGGTNALVVDHPSFTVDFHGWSYHDHRQICNEIGAVTREIDSFRLATDIDSPTDLVEVLLHSAGRTRDCLLDFGIDLRSLAAHDATEVGDSALDVVQDL